MAEEGWGEEIGDTIYGEDVVQKTGVNMQEVCVQLIEVLQLLCLRPSKLYYCHPNHLWPTISDRHKC